MAYSALVSSVIPGTEMLNYRTLGPQYTCAAFAIELYIKCILVDCGCTMIPAKHDLLLLFGNIPRQTREPILKLWRTTMVSLKGMHEITGRTPADMETVLGNLSDAFDKWRYRFEYDKAMLTMDDDYGHVHCVLHYFIYNRHPEWREDSDQYFLSTFPAP